MKFQKFLCLIFLMFLFICSSALPTDIVTTAQNGFFDPSDQTRIGIEVEFTGLNPSQAAKLIEAQLNSPFEIKLEQKKGMRLREPTSNGEIYSIKQQKQYDFEYTKIGKVVLKDESNVTSDYEDDSANLITELVTAPLKFDDLDDLQKILTTLKEAGAQGTTEKSAVATQVNLEIGGGKRENIKIIDVVNILRSYILPQHREQMEERLAVPKIRRKYLQPFSRGFTKRILNADYNPSDRKFFDDYFYRQSLELLGFKTAWTMPITKARKLLMEQPNPVVPAVAKLNLVRISSLLMYLFPLDPMSIAIQEAEWAVPGPYIEFREMNTDFDIRPAAQTILGLKTAAEKYGYYDHDKLLGSASTLGAPLLKDLRGAVQKSEKTNKPVIFRYYLGEDTPDNRTTYTEQDSYYKGTPVGFLPANKYGKIPVYIQGESVVFHRRPFHRFSVLGKYNISLPNFNIQQALENKYVEYLFWNDFSPGIMARTALLSDVAKDAHDPETMLKRISESYPNGWVLKGTWDLGSEKEIITDKTDILSELKKYKESDFNKFKQKVDGDSSLREMTPEYKTEVFKEHRGYRGWKISQMLSSPNAAIVQERVDISREFRVEIVAGKVLGDGSTVDRWKYTFVNADKLKYRPPTKIMINQVEKFAQDAVNRLSPDLQSTVFGMDIAVLKDGKIVMIESNPGGNSNFLFEEDKESVRALRKRMEEYPEMVRRGEANPGMAPTQQMLFLEALFSKYSVDKAKIYPNMQFLVDRIEDPDFNEAAPDPREFTVECNAALKNLRRRSR